MTYIRRRIAAVVCHSCVPGKTMKTKERNKKNVNKIKNGHSVIVYWPIQRFLEHRILSCVHVCGIYVKPTQICGLIYYPAGNLKPFLLKWSSDTFIKFSSFLPHIQYGEGGEANEFLSMCSH